MSTGKNYLDNVRSLFRYYKSLGDKALAQLDDAALCHQIHSESNSIGVIVNHLSGNMLSRWKDFLASDGEKTWRNRDAEFEENLKNKQEVIDAWEKGWACVFLAIDPLEESDLGRIVYIRNEGHTVLEAINRQLAHYSYHIGQIVLLAKAIKGEDWQSLSIPKGGSGAFNQAKFGAEKGRRNFV